MSHPKIANVTQLAQQAEERAFQYAKTQARLRTLSLAQVLEELDKRARSTHWWLEKFSDGRDKRPDTQIEQKQLELAVLVQVRDRLKDMPATKAATT